jgi:hypothetical protein
MVESGECVVETPDLFKGPVVHRSIRVSRRYYCSIHRKSAEDREGFYVERFVGLGDFIARCIDGPQKTSRSRRRRDSKDACPSFTFRTLVVSMSVLSRVSS